MHVLLQNTIVTACLQPKFWPIFQKSSEYNDGEPYPLDHWCVRVLESLAGQLHAIALLSFGGPPFLPFYSWALRIGRTHVSPIKFLLQDQSGLFLSFRGALAFKEHISLPAHPEQSPCVGCLETYMVAFPVNALEGESYDVTACKSLVMSIDNKHCSTQGCATQRACPISQRFSRLPAQSEFHIKAFF